MLNNHLIEIQSEWLELPEGVRIFTSLEGEHPGGSIKDRMVYGELSELTQSGRLKEGDVVGEVSAGSTAISLARHTQDFKLKTLLFVPDTTSSEIVASLKQKGAEVMMHPLAQIYPIFQNYCDSRPEVYAFNQLYDESKRRHYSAFGAWLAEQDSGVEEIWGAVGTGHSLAGIRDGFKRLKTKARTLTVEPDLELRIPGIRNLTRDRYGELDRCQRSDFEGSLEVSADELYPFETISSSAGTVKICGSFKLVLGAVRKFRDEIQVKNLFLLGAALQKTEN